MEKSPVAAACGFLKEIKQKIIIYVFSPVLLYFLEITNQSQERVMYFIFFLISSHIFVTLSYVRMKICLKASKKED